MRAAIILAAVVSLAGCGGGEESRPGSPAVYQRIEALTDCQALQREFDQAAANHEREPAGSAAREAALGYMKAAEARRKQLGCR